MRRSIEKAGSFLFWQILINLSIDEFNSHGQFYTKKIPFAPVVQTGLKCTSQKVKG